MTMIAILFCLGGDSEVMAIEVELIKIRNFQTQKHIMANQLKVDDYEAETLLLDELILTRLNKYTYQEILELMHNDEKKFAWEITHARKDVYRKHQQKLNKEKQLVIRLKLNTRDSIINLGNTKNLDETNTQKVIDLLPQIFSNRSTREFVKLVLLYGKEETECQLGIDEKQFNKKLQNIEYFCRKHNEQFINLVVNKKDEELLSEQQMLRELEECLNRGDYEDNLLQILINKYKDYLDDILGNYKYYHTNHGKLLNDYANQLHKEQYKLVNCISDRLKEVGDKLRC